MSEIEKLYYNMGESILVDLPETQEASNRLYEELGDAFMSEHEEVITRLTSANEKQGFICGFQYAVKLMLEGKENFCGKPASEK